MEYTATNTIKQRANGKPVVIVPLMLYTDDTSGNKTKKWNKFDVYCLLLAGLPKESNTDLHNIHFITCSNNLSAIDMAQPIVEDLQKVEDGVEMFDAKLGKNVLVIAPLLCFLCDNARASEICSHLGSTASKFCRICQVHVGTHKI